jgi:hypothetical protein
MLRSVLLLILGFGASQAFAQGEYSESTFSKYQHSVWLSTGFTEGGFSLGADYEYATDRTFGVGGLTRFYNKDTDRSANGIVMFGAFIRPHFHRRAWDLYVNPGIAIINIDNASNGEDATTLGPLFAVGLLYQMGDTVAFGVENMMTSVWFDDDYLGVIMNDLMFRARFSF